MSKLDEIMTVTIGKTDDDGVYYEEVHLDRDDFAYLYQQAERVEELEDNYIQQLDESQSTYDYFKSEINRYKQALEEIASVKKDEEFNPYAYMMIEIIEMAEQALKEGESQ